MSARPMNDLELTILQRELNTLNVAMNLVGRNGTPDGMLDVAAKLEDAARKLGWRSLELRDHEKPIPRLLTRVPA